MAVEAGSGTGPAGLTAQKLCIKKPPRDPERPGHQILEPGRVSRTEPGSELQIGVAPPPVPSRQLGARGPAPREPQPFPGGRAWRCGDTPAPAPTGARRAQECSPPDSPAPPSYLRRPSIKHCRLPPATARPAAAPPGSPARSARPSAAQAPSKVGAVPSGSRRPRARCLPPCPGTPGLARKGSTHSCPGPRREPAWLLFPRSFPEDWQALVLSAHAARTGTRLARV